MEKYGWALVDNHKEKVGNFRMEMPGLFRGRGQHPKAGMVKARTMPEDVTLNLSEGAPIPPCPIPGHKWGAIVHKPEVQHHHLVQIAFSNSLGVVAGYV